MEQVRYSTRRLAEVLGVTPRELPEQKPAYSVDDLAAALAATEGYDDLLALLESDGDASVRATCAAARREAAPAQGAARTALRVLAEGGSR